MEYMAQSEVRAEHSVECEKSNNYEPQQIKLTNLWHWAPSYGLHTYKQTLETVRNVA